MASTGNPKGRPPSQIDLKKFKKLCQYHFTVVELAASLDVSRRTLLRKLKVEPYKTIWAEGEANGRAFLKRRGFEFAAMDSSQGERAWEHLTKNMLGWSDRLSAELADKNGGSLGITQNIQITMTLAAPKTDDEDRSYRDATVVPIRPKLIESGS